MPGEPSPSPAPPSLPDPPPEPLPSTLPTPLHGLQHRSLASTRKEGPGTAPPPSQRRAAQGPGEQPGARAVARAQQMRTEACGRPAEGIALDVAQEPACLLASPAPGCRSN